MRNRNTSLFALLIAAPLLVGNLTGCGRAATSQSIPDEALFSAEAATDQVVVIPKDKIRPEVKPAVGVVVDGRVYPKGSEPKAETAANVAAPEAGKANVKVSIKLASKLAFTHTMRVILFPKGQGNVAFSQDFTSERFHGTKLETVAPNLEPGSYDVSLELYNETGKLYDRFDAETTLEADKTASVTF